MQISRNIYSARNLETSFHKRKKGKWKENLVKCHENEACVWSNADECHIKQEDEVGSRKTQEKCWQKY